MLNSAFPGGSFWQYPTALYLSPVYIQSLRTIIDRRRPRRRQVVLPFICPADHIFRLNEWVGASIGFREYSFLRHPRLQFSAAWQSATPARVRLCGARPDLPACPALPPTSTTSGPALVPVGSTDGELKRHLEPLAHTKVSCPRAPPSRLPAPPVGLRWCPWAAPTAS
jgi:hypothetical protein